MEPAVEHAIPTFLQYGAMGVLALAFIVLLVLYVRSDKRNQKYAAKLDETSFDRTQLIQVVVENTKAFGALAGVIDKLKKRFNGQTCPFIDESADGGRRSRH